MKRYLIPLLLLGATAANACPELSDRSDERTAIIEQLKAADTYRKGQSSIKDMWLLWREAPDEKAQILLDKGLSNIHVADYEQAESDLFKLVKYCPAYVEGHNQLAFAYFLQEKYTLSHESLDRVLDIEPLHFAALSGKALNYQAEGLDDIAQIYLRRAIALNPWLNERHMLRPLKGETEL